MDNSSRWIIKEIAAIARTASGITTRIHAGEVVPVEERVQYQRRKIALLDAINRRSPYQTGAEVALIEAERELQRLERLQRPHAGPTRSSGAPEATL